MKDIIKAYLENHVGIARLLSAEGHVQKLAEIAGIISNALKKGGKVVLFGNGGSSADAQHIVTELVGKFKRKRDAIAALALNTNVSIITAIANDYSYDQVFARQVEAVVDEKDVVIGISTSGTSPSVIEGIRAARQKGACTIGFTGRSGGWLKDITDVCLMVPSDETPHIQEMHITLGHILCHLLESEIRGKEELVKREVKKEELPVKIIALDIDGVLTDGTVTISGDRESKALFYRDMDAIVQGKRQGLMFGLITGEENPMVDTISKRLKIDLVITGAKYKTEAIKKLSNELNIPLEQVCYIGDSKRDAEAIGMVGFGLAPANADREAQSSARCVLRSQGGKGAVAEAIEWVMQKNARIQRKD